MAKPPRAWVLPGRAAAIVLGRSQHGTAAHTPLPVRLRASGGGAVLTGPWLLRAAVRLPPGHPVLRHGAAAAAAWFGQAHLDWLHRRGIRGARLYEGPVSDHWACFAGRGPGEIVVGERKLVGIAQAWRRSSVLLSSGVLLRAPPWELLCEALGQGAGAAATLAQGTVCAEECMGRAIDPAAWARSLQSALALALRDAGIEGALAPCQCVAAPLA